MDCRGGEVPSAPSNYKQVGGLIRSHDPILGGHIQDQPSNQLLVHVASDADQVRPTQGERQAHVIMCVDHVTHRHSPICTSIATSPWNSNELP